MRTVLTTVDVTAKRGSATTLDRGHHTLLVKAYVTGVGCAPRLAMATEDISEFELWRQHVQNLDFVTDRAAPSYRVVGNTPGDAQTGRRPRTHSLAPTSRPKNL